MDNIYFLMLSALGLLACGGLIVGVSNDAVNFLNSALGSRAISPRFALILASIGIALGAIFSTGMMEIARSGIFHPEMFVFQEVMFIFTAVMLTDILLLDFFNTLGLPTSTTVSIVFELLGASVAMALIKIGAQHGDFSTTFDYINTKKATDIVFSILLSVALSFTIGMIVQWFSRFWLSFNYEKKPIWMSAVFGGISITSIIYFIMLKGIKGTSFAQKTFDILGGQTLKAFLESNAYFTIGANLFIWFLVSYFIISVLKVNIYKVIIGIGTFSLALAFAGNDLVNFIGVPMAAYQSYMAWAPSGISPTEFNMAVLQEELISPPIILFISGVIMIFTLWFSKKARHVAETEINLAREGESKEKFEPNFISRSIVRFTVDIAEYTNTILPISWKKRIAKQFKKPSIQVSKNKAYQLPAFDMVRASVNLVVSGILIAIATSFKLPLSTTYVTFMVAMGTSLADQAWGTESAVYRVAGVLNVIGGWFGTAIIAFISASLILVLISFGKGAAIALLLFGTILLIFRSYINYSRRSKEQKAEDRLSLSESSSVQGVIEESAKNISKILIRSKNIYENIVEGLDNRDLKLLKKNKKQVEKMTSETEEIRNHIFFFIKNLDESSVEASNFYFNELGYLQDISQSLDHMSKISFKHINNNHQKLKPRQIKELREIDKKLTEDFFNPSIEIFEKGNFGNIEDINKNKEIIQDFISEKIDKQIKLIRTEDSSPKNTTLYFTILNETKDLVDSIMNLIELFNREYVNSKKTIKN